MSEPLVVVDADALGRMRTGDETYVLNLLRELPPLAAAAGIRIAAVTRRPELVPEGVEALRLATPSQELRMVWALPRLLRHVGAALVHTQYALPLGGCPGVVTIHDLSFERDATLMRRKDRLVFRSVVPRAARRARRVLTVSERSKRDLIDLYDLAPERIVVTPNGVDPAFTMADGGGRGGYVLAVGSVEERKNQLAAAAAAAAAGLPLVVAGPIRDEAVARALRASGADVRGWVEQDELVRLYRGAVCLVQASRFEGFGLPAIEAMACGTPVVAVPEPALREVAGDAALYADEAGLGGAIRDAIADRDRLVAAGLERARRFTWRAAADRTLEVYREALVG